MTDRFSTGDLIIDCFDNVGIVLAIMTGAQLAELDSNYDMLSKRTEFVVILPALMSKAHGGALFGSNGFEVKHLTSWGLKKIT